MKYIVYLTTNTKCSVNGVPRIYVGVHKTRDPGVFDGYIGNGVYVNSSYSYMYPKTPFQVAVKKYGVDAFKRTILFIYDTTEEASAKEAEIVDKTFVSQDHTYNIRPGGYHEFDASPVYQFDLNGALKKKWQSTCEAEEFYGLPADRLRYYILDKHSYLDSYWSRDESIDLSSYRTTPHGSPAPTYLYSLEGKCLEIFNSRKELAEYLGMDDVSISTAIRRQRAVQKKYYVSDKLTDLFIPKPRSQYLNTVFHVYKETGELVGKYKGKELMPVLKMHSWSRIRDIIVDGNGWYKEFYVSEEPVNELPERAKMHRVGVDVYDKWGNFIETMESVRDLRERYNVPASRIKNIQQGNRYYKDWIFKYHHA